MIHLTKILGSLYFGLLTILLICLSSVYSSAQISELENLEVENLSPVEINLNVLASPASGSSILSIDILTPPSHGTFLIDSLETVAFYTATESLVSAQVDSIELGVVFEEEIDAVYLFNLIILWTGDSCTIDCIWPGDTDNNGLANMYDLLPIGLAYFTQGEPRESLDTDWYPHQGLEWSESFAGINAKHIDCNGDGFINEDDITAISENYGRVSGKGTEEDDISEDAVPLFLDILTDSIELGEPVVANIILGSLESIAEDVYGLAFEVNYPTQFIDSSTVQIDFSNTWIAEDSSEFISIQHNHFDGSIDAAITRLNQVPTQGFGVLGTMTFIMEDVIINGKGNGLEENYDVLLDFGEVRMINGVGDQLEVFGSGDEALLLSINPELPSPNLSRLQIYPNPAKDILFVKTENLEEVQLLDLQGKSLIRKSDLELSDQLSFDVSNINNGLYILEVKTSKGKQYKKIMIK